MHWSDRGARKRTHVLKEKRPNPGNDDKHCERCGKQAKDQYWIPISGESYCSPSPASSLKSSAL